MTEEEAKTKRCHRKFGFATEDSLCEGSACMAWRWERLTSGYPSHDVRGNPIEVQYAARESTTNGCCGLAGQP